MTITYQEIQRVLHTLWSKAVGTEDYDKAEWKRLDAILQELWNAAKR